MCSPSNSHSLPVSNLCNRKKRHETILDTGQQVEAVPRLAPLVDTRTIGKAPTFTGEHKDWPVWSFQCIAYMGSANPKSIEAMRWAAMEDDKITAAAVTQTEF